jgi:hypothetical protein
MSSYRRLHDSRDAIPFSLVAAPNWTSRASCLLHDHRSSEEEAIDKEELQYRSRHCNCGFLIYTPENVSEFLVDNNNNNKDVRVEKVQRSSMLMVDMATQVQCVVVLGRFPMGIKSMSWCSELFIKTKLLVLV